MNAKRYVILAEGKFHYLLSKTGNALLRYKPDEVVAIIDSTNTGKTSSEIIGYGGVTPVLAAISESYSYEPDTVVIGIAPPGGVLPESWRAIIIEAIKHGLDIISGLHTFLTEDKELIELAEKYSVELKDLRKPSQPLTFFKGSWQRRKTPVLLTVGSDCDTSKMTTAWELTQLLNDRGIKAAFVGTGQTGILLSGRGVAIDAIVSDFMAGMVEAEIDKLSDDYDIILVEGQGAINHIAYSGVALGLLHGVMPDMMIMCHDPDRILDTIDYPIPELSVLFDLHSNLLRPFKESKFVGICLLTHTLNEDEARRSVELYRQNYPFPVTDIIRYGGENIIETILAELQK